MNQVTTITLSLVVSPLLTILTTALPGAVQGRAYNFQLAASGGTAPYTWTASGLPAGLSCSASGLISGTPSVAGSFPAVQVTVTDSGV